MPCPPRFGLCVTIAFAGGKKKRQKKPKSSKTLALNDFLADTSTGTNFAKDPPKRTGSWADAMEERLDAEGGEVLFKLSNTDSRPSYPKQRCRPHGRVVVEAVQCLTVHSCPVLPAKLRPGTLTGGDSQRLHHTLSTLATCHMSVMRMILSTSLGRRT